MHDPLGDALRRVEALKIPDPSSAAEGPRPEPLTLDALRDWARDGALAREERLSALRSLADRFAHEPPFAETVLALIDDPALAAEAIAVAPPFDARIIARLRALLDDPRPAIWTAAASALARKKDRAILPLMFAWARTGDAAHRRSGLTALGFLLIPEDHLAAVEAICEDGPRDEEDEALLVEALRVADARVAFWRKHARVEPEEE